MDDYKVIQQLSDGKTFLLWYEGNFRKLKEVVQYLMDSTLQPDVYTIILEDGKEIPLVSFCEIFHIRKKNI